MILPFPRTDVPDGDGETFTTFAANFMASKLAMVAAELGLFERLADGPLTLDELAKATAIAPRPLRVVATGLVALDLLQLDGDRYRNAPAAQAFLTGRGAVDVRAAWRFYDQVCYPMWMQLAEVVRSGAPARLDASPEQARVYSEGVAVLTGFAARALPDRFEFAPHRRLLDVGGGTGSYLVPLLERYPSLRATLFERPAAAAVARRALAQSPARERIEIVEGDALTGALPDGHDVMLMASIIHLFSPEKVTRLLANARERAERGCKLLIVDQWMDRTHTQPALAAMVACTALIVAGDGDTYSVDEAEPWLQKTGWRLLDHRALSGVTSMVVAEAR